MLNAALNAGVRVVEAERRKYSNPGLNALHKSSYLNVLCSSERVSFPLNLITWPSNCFFFRRKKGPPDRDSRQLRVRLRCGPIKISASNAERNAAYLSQSTFQPDRDIVN